MPTADQDNPSPGNKSKKKLPGKAFGPVPADAADTLVSVWRGQKTVKKAEGVAMANVGLLGVFGMFTLSNGAAGNYPILLLSIAFGGMAWNEFQGRKLLLNLDLRGPTRLAVNQLMLGLVLVAYFGWRIADVALSEVSIGDEIMAIPELAAGLGEYVTADAINWMFIAFYSLILLLTLAFQPAVAAYYYTRRKPMQKLIDNSPDWAIDLLKELS